MGTITGITGQKSLLRNEKGGLELMHDSELFPPSHFEWEEN